MSVHRQHRCLLARSVNTVNTVVTFRQHRLWIIVIRMIPERHHVMGHSGRTYGRAPCEMMLMSFFADVYYVCSSLLIYLFCVSVRCV